MDFIRHETPFLYENNTYNIESDDYVKLCKNMDRILTTYSCFFQKVATYTKSHQYGNNRSKFSSSSNIRGKVNHFNKNTGAPVTTIRKKIRSEDCDDSFLVLRSNLNKLSPDNYRKIFPKIQSVFENVDDLLQKEYIVYILTTSSNAKMYCELYVGLLMHIIEVNKIKDTFVYIFDEHVNFMLDIETYKVDDFSETYDMFCSRTKLSLRLINSVTTVYLILQDDFIRKNCFINFDKYASFLLELLLEKSNSQNVHDIQLEQLLEIIKHCIFLGDTIQIPTLKDIKFLPCKKLITKNTMRIYKLTLIGSIPSLSNRNNNKINFKLADINDQLVSY
jgi:hypothetical protein